MFNMFTILLAILSVTSALKQSPGCGKELPKQPHPGHHHRFHIQYEDKYLGSLDREYILQIPPGELI